MTILNPTVHENLINQGYTHKHYEEGRKESDRYLTIFTVSSAYDEYSNDIEYVFVDASGILDREDRDLELEKFMNEVGH